ncbi:MAG: hypothetical protein IKJ56_02425, partial [Bacteroidales bacterium]|nr:hypothetical protein [Bacteroidales bacterium]
MVVKIDNNGNKLYSTFIGDAQYDVNEGGISANSVHTTEAGLYQFMFNIGPRIKILSYEFDETLQITDSIRISTDSTNTPKMLSNMFINEYIYIGGQYLPDFTEYLAKYDTNGNVIAEAERTNYIGLCSMIPGKNGNIIAAGLKSNNNHNWVVQKLDTSLNIIWQKTYGRTDMVNGVQIFIAPSPDNCYVMSGVYP